MLPCLSVALRHWSPAQIALPSIEEAADLTDLVNEHFPNLGRFIGFFNGMSCPHDPE